MPPAPKTTAFWSGETLEARLPTLVEPFRAENIDCAAYTLSIGSEVYVSPTTETSDPASVTIRTLGKDEAFTIPPGQFAFLLTDEIVSIPTNAIGFISIKAKIKFRGLVNVSGFHVDPGFRGRLIFSVFNAGPVALHLRQGQPCFLIWFAGLDRVSSKVKTTAPQLHLDPALITAISGEVFSLQGLAKKISQGDTALEERLRGAEHSLEKRFSELEKLLTDRVHRVESRTAPLLWMGLLVMSVIVSLFGSWFRENFMSKGPSQEVPAMSTPAPEPGDQPPAVVPKEAPPERAAPEEAPAAPAANQPTRPPPENEPAQ